ncbi:MAG: hypothetical protein QOD52_1517 [Gaiellaceae bacterium]|nr:hypothetical protein [Gaiellaceae bacterium]
MSAVRRLLATVALAAFLALSAGAAGASFDEVNVSRLRGAQAEVAIAADPAHPGVLLAASNSIDFKSYAALGNLMRTYASADGGATWAVGAGPTPTPYGGRKRCNAGDPAPAIDATGRQYLAFLASACITIDSLVALDREFDVARLEVASRANAASPWTIAQVYPVRSRRFDDKPSLAVDRSPASPHLGRVYAAWTRITPGGKSAQGKIAIVLSHSDDGGATWSRPVVVPDSANPETSFSSIAIDASGTVFVSWMNVRGFLLIDRSTDGGDTFGTDVVVDAAAGLSGSVCDQPGSIGVPAQLKRCITSSPTVLVDSRAGAAERVYLTYDAPDASGRAQDVMIRAFDSSLVPFGPAHAVHPLDAKRDEFLPASAVDDAGRVWVCFYDTVADKTRRTARYSCTASVDGGETWALPHPVASVASDETSYPSFSFQYGDYEGVTVAGGVAHPIWTDSRDLLTRGEEIYTTTLTPADLQLP